MFDSVFTRLVRSGVWRDTAAADLPQMPSQHDDLPSATQQLLLVAGGLALVLSRCPASMRGRRFPAATRLYALLRRDLRRNDRSSARAALLLDAFHEVTMQLDAVSHQAFKRCLQARRDHDAAALDARRPSGR